jgi:predicted nucleic acid-binding protein
LEVLGAGAVTGVVERVEEVRPLLRGPEPVVASELVRFELAAGVRDDETAALEDFFASLSWVPVDEQISRAAGGFARRYRRAYRGIDDVDFIIGATAIVLDAELVTTNVTHFPMIEGLLPAY